MNKSMYIPQIGTLHNYIFFEKKLNYNGQQPIFFIKNELFFEMDFIFKK